jgi:hypothetical protein
MIAAPGTSWTRNPIGSGAWSGYRYPRSWDYGTAWLKPTGLGSR